ncbi:MAG: class I SAM-dependent methyltransferase [Eubacterium sp.]|nr:class I SAM-dependent methyltransferase [Eubacterium sp.]
MDALTEQIMNSETLSDEALARKIDQFLHIHTEEVQTDGRDTFHCHRYEPTSYRVLHTLFEAIPLTDQDTLLDYGSGLGRLSFYTNHRFHNSAIGIELSGTFHREALHNLRQYRGIHRERLTFLLGKAEDFVIPDEVNFVYCFNPFSTDIFRKVLTNIGDSYENKPRKITLILYYPEDNTIFYIERHTGFRLVKEIAVPDLFEGDRREKFCIYELGE